jgi:hypothetical protein
MKVALVVILLRDIRFRQTPRKVKSPPPPPRPRAAPTSNSKLKWAPLTRSTSSSAKLWLYVIEDLGQCPNCTGGSTGRFTNTDHPPQQWAWMARGSEPTRAAPTFSSQPLPASTISASTGNRGSTSAAGLLLASEPKLEKSGPPRNTISWPLQRKSGWLID